MKRKVGFKPRQKPMKRTPLRRVSKKRRAEAVIYNAKGKGFMEANPLCNACWKIFGRLPYPSTDRHHAALRGPNYLNEETWIAVCRECHDWIHSNARAARVLGLLK